MYDNLDELNPIFMMADSGTRGSFQQIRQLAGKRGGNSIIGHGIDFGAGCLEFLEAVHHLLFGPLDVVGARLVLVGDGRICAVERTISVCRPNAEYPSGRHRHETDLAIARHGAGRNTQIAAGSPAVARTAR